MVVDGGEERKPLETVSDLGDCSDSSLARRIDALDAVLTVGPEYHGAAPVDDGQPVEPAPAAVGVRDRGDVGRIAHEDAANPRREIRAKRNRASFVHRGPQRPDRRQPTTRIRDRPQSPVAEHEDTLAAPRKVTVKARLPSKIQIRMAGYSGKDVRPNDLRGNLAAAGKDSTAAVSKRRLERHHAKIVHGSHVRREVAELLLCGCDHRPGNHLPILRAWRGRRSSFSWVFCFSRTGW